MAADISFDPYFGAVYPNDAGGPMSRWTCFWIAVALTLVGGFLLPAFAGSRCYCSTETMCRNNLRNITLGLVAYKNLHGDWPPARTFDAQGRPLHSWRTLILPYVDQQELYESIDLNKPWDDPVNTKAAATILPSMICPASLRGDGRTNFLAVLCKDGSWLADPSGPPTIVLMEVEDFQAVPWMSTFDANEATVASAFGTNTAGNHAKIINIGLSDGSTLAIPHGDPEKQLTRLMSPRP